jgi:hypothetical protein
LLQSQAITRLAFSHYNSEYRDKILATRIAGRIEDKTGSRLKDKVVVVVGFRDIVPDDGILLPQYELFLGSFFSWDQPLDQHRKFDFMRFLGYSYIYPNEGQISKASVEAFDMPIWPHEDSVRYLDDDNLVVVKLSNDIVGFNGIGMEKLICSRGNIDLAQITVFNDKKAIEIKGWMASDDTKNLFEKMCIHIGDKAFAAIYGIERYDVAVAPKLRYVGFSTMIPADSFSDGTYPVEIAAIARDGEIYQFKDSLTFSKEHDSMTISE